MKFLLTSKSGYVKSGYVKIALPQGPRAFLGHHSYVLRPYFQIAVTSKRIIKKDSQGALQQQYFQSDAFFMTSVVHVLHVTCIIYTLRFINKFPEGFCFCRLTNFKK
jgi:hypothetical protein